MVIHKYYYFDCNGTGMEYIENEESIESEGTHAVGKCPRYAFIKIYIEVTVKYSNLYCNGTGYGIHRYYQ